MLSSNETHASIFLNALTGLGPRRYQNLVKAFGSARGAVSAGPRAWAEVEDFGAPVVADVEAEYALCQKVAEQDVGLLEEMGARVLLWQEGPYPRLLKEISSAPPIIYALGREADFDQPAVAVVGSRRSTYYGEKASRQLAEGLVEAGVRIVSGLARGIDTVVHEATLNAKGKTWAVVGSGLGSVYPPENQKLFERIQQSGAILSEFPMQTKPHPANFPRRNRIIAGLTLGTVVVEGTEKSGSLITARLAAEEGREVFAVPGPIGFPQSRAPNLLIRSGAALTESAEDILSVFGLSKQPVPMRTDSGTDDSSQTAASASIQRVMANVGGVPIPKEVLSQRTKLDPAALSSLLLEMELHGFVRCLPGGFVVKA